jgi:CubicO group peptidase (beta-lactamase class C family)
LTGSSATNQRGVAHKPCDELPQMDLKLHPFVVLGAVALGSSLWLWSRSVHQTSHDLDAYMRAQVQNSHFSGTVLVARDNQVIFQHAYGFADLAKNLTNREDTRFAIASLSKQFTAVLIMRLQENGKLLISDPICRYLEPCPAAWSAIRISQLLSHTSGIPNFTDDSSFMAMRSSFQSREQILTRFRSKPLEFSPGEKYRYSNSNYFLLGIIIETVTGLSFQENLSRYVLLPLNMTETGLESSNPPLGRRARGYRTNSDGRIVDADFMDPSWSFGAGEIYSTVGDLKKWDDALYTESLLPSAVLRSMWIPVKENYGFGWEIPAVSKVTLNRRLLIHSGHTDGFVSCMSRFPDQKVVIIVLANYEMAKHACSVASGLASIAFGEKNLVKPDPVEVHLDPRMEARYVGKYHLDFYDEDMSVTLEDGHLFAIIGQIPKAEMFAASEREFFFKTFDAQIDFSVGSTGKITGFVAHVPMRDDVKAIRLE